MRKALAASLILFTSPIVAVPTAADLEQRNLNCKVVDYVINVFAHNTLQASSFCSSYLQTTTTSFYTTLEQTAVKTVKVTGTITAYHTLSTITSLVARGAAIARPTWLPTALGSKIVSSACSCYVTPPAPLTTSAVLTSGTTTITETSTVPIATATGGDLYCGVVGCGQGNEGYLGGGPGYTSVDLCKALCLATPGCITFIYSAAQGDACGAYNLPVSSVYDPGSPSAPPGVCDNQYIYDVRCSV